MSFVYTTAIDKLRGMTKRKKVVQGGTWAGKTFGIIPILIDDATKDKNNVYTVTAETIPALKGGAIKDFKTIMQDTGRWVESRWNATDLHYTFASGIKMEFKSFDSVGKAQAAGKRKKLFINEAPYIPFEIADALIGRTTDDIYIDFNPTHEFWAHTEILPNKDAEFLLLRYTDNEALPTTILEELKMKLEKAYYRPELGNVPGNIKSPYWANWCKVYVDGEIGSLQGTVFQFTTCDDVPMEAEMIGYGLDWGYTNDPTALVAVYRLGRTLYLEELIYRTGLTNSMIAEQMNFLEVSKHRPIIADNAEPKSITDLQTMGYGNTIAAQKGKDSILNSITALQDYSLVVTSRSLNIIKELRNYRWQTDNTGKSLNTPIDAYNHSIDAIRYVALNCLKTQSGQYAVV